MSEERRKQASGGMRTNPQRISEVAAQAGIDPSALRGGGEWNEWRRHFVPLEVPVERESVFEKQRESTPFYLVPPAFAFLEAEQEAERQREAERIEQQNRRKQQDRERLKRLTTQFLGREPSPAEMNEIWLQAVDEAEAASNIGIEETPWQPLERMATDPERPGAEGGGETSTSTQTSRRINLTDPKTAEGIAQNAIRNALGRRASDDEIRQFTQALNQTERANPQVTTTTTTQTAEGDSTTESFTEGSSPQPTAVAEAWLDDELNAEIDVYRAATDYFQVAQALAEGVA